MIDYLRPATPADVDHVAIHMRPEDRRECEAAGLASTEALWASYRTSEVAYSLVAPDGEVVAVVGVCPGTNGPTWGAIWLLGTDGIKRNAKTFLKHSKEALAQLYADTGKEVFYNYTFSENTVHHDWLRWLGFTFLPSIKLGEADFIPFVRLKG